MTPLETAAEVLTLDAGATPNEVLMLSHVAMMGPWTLSPNGLAVMDRFGGQVCMIRRAGAADETDRYNARLIAHYRTSAPALARAVVEMAGEIERLEAELEAERSDPRPRRDWTDEEIRSASR